MEWLKRLATGAGVRLLYSLCKKIETGVFMSVSVQSSQPNRTAPNSLFRDVRLLFRRKADIPLLEDLAESMAVRGDRNASFAAEDGEKEKKVSHPRSAVAFDNDRRRHLRYSRWSYWIAAKTRMKIAESLASMGYFQDAALQSLSSADLRYNAGKSDMFALGMTDYYQGKMLEQAGETIDAALHMYLAYHFYFIKAGDLNKAFAVGREAADLSFKGGDPNIALKICDELAAVAISNHENMHAASFYHLASGYAKDSEQAVSYRSLADEQVSIHERSIDALSNLDTTLKRLAPPFP